jgi:hypothetical protein
MRRGRMVGCCWSLGNVACTRICIGRGKCIVCSEERKDARVVHNVCVPSEQQSTTSLYALAAIILYCNYMLSSLSTKCMCLAYIMIFVCSFETNSNSIKRRAACKTNISHFFNTLYGLRSDNTLFLLFCVYMCWCCRMFYFFFLNHLLQIKVFTIQIDSSQLYTKIGFLFKY